jgi:hypothetical protein
MQTRTKVLAVAGAVVVTLVGAGTAVALTSGSDVADCYAGTGATPEGQQFAATLRLREDGGRVSGTYVASPSADVAVTYRVVGTLDDGRFAGTFTAAGQGGDGRRRPAAGRLPPWLLIRRRGGRCRRSTA